MNLDMINRRGGCAVPLDFYMAMEVEPKDLRQQEQDAEGRDDPVREGRGQTHTKNSSMARLVDSQRPAIETAAFQRGLHLN